MVAFEIVEVSGQPRPPSTTVMTNIMESTKSTKGGRPLFRTNPSGKLVKGNLNPLGMDSGAGVSILKSDILLLQKRIDTLETVPAEDIVLPLSRQMQEQEKLLLSMPVSDDAQTQGVLLELLVKKIHELSSCLLKVTKDKEAIPSQAARASSVEAFLGLVDHMSGIIVAKYEEELEQVDIVQERKESIRKDFETQLQERDEQIKALTEQLQAAQEKYNNMMDEQREKLESAQSKPGTLRGKGADSQAGGLSEADIKKLQEENERMQGLLDIYSRTNEAAYTTAFEGLTTDGFLQSVGLKVKVPKVEESTPSSLQVGQGQSMPPSSGGRKTSRRLSAVDPGLMEKSKLQMEAMNLNMNRQNRVLQELMREIPELLKVHTDEKERLSVNLKETKCRLEKVLEDLEMLRGKSTIAEQKLSLLGQTFSPTATAMALVATPTAPTPLKGSTVQAPRRNHAPALEPLKSPFSDTGKETHKVHKLGEEHHLSLKKEILETKSKLVEVTAELQSTKERLRKNQLALSYYKTRVDRHAAEVERLETHAMTANERAEEEMRKASEAKDKTIQTKLQVASTIDRLKESMFQAGRLEEEIKKLRLQATKTEKEHEEALSRLELKMQYIEDDSTHKQQEITYLRTLLEEGGTGQLHQLLSPTSPRTPQ